MYSCGTLRLRRNADAAIAARGPSSCRLTLPVPSLGPALARCPSTATTPVRSSYTPPPARLLLCHVRARQKSTTHTAPFPLARQVHFRATSGVNGQGSNCDGADAEDLLVPVPAGTIIRRRCDPALARVLGGAGRLANPHWGLLLGTRRRAPRCNVPPRLLPARPYRTRHIRSRVVKAEARWKH